MRKIKNSRGITLIALVITIIVLLILAGISIATLTGENGILKKASLAKRNTEEAAIKEEIELAIQEILIEKHEEFPLTNEKIAQYLGEKLKGIVIGKISDTTISGEYKGYDFEVDSNHRVKILGKTTGKVSYTLDPEGYTTESVTITITVEFKNDLTLSSITSQTEGVETVEVNKKFKVTQNGLYEFKMVDSNGTEKDINIPINTIDRDAPEIKIEIDNKTNYINGKAKAKVTIEDQQTGVNLEKCKWIINQSSDKVGDNLDSYTGNFESEIQGVESEKVTKAGATYYVHVIATDLAENSEEIVSDAITIKNGYAISTQQELQNMGNDLTGHYYVINDINLEGEFTPIAGYFKGSLDGQGFTINNLFIRVAGDGVYRNRAGLFECLDGNSVVQDLLLKNVDVEITGEYGGPGAGALAGAIETPNYGKPNVTISKVGVQGVVAGTCYVGGLVGGLFDIGTFQAHFEDCYSRVDIRGGSSIYGAGFAGFRSYVSGQDRAKVSFLRCYWSGTMSNARTDSSTVFYKGLGSSVDKCYFNQDKYNSGHFTGEGLTTSEMGDKSKYIGWDFNNTWYMGEDNLPELKF